MPIGFGTQFTGMNSDEIISLLRQTYPGIKKEEQIRGNGPARYLKIPGFSGAVGFIDAVHCKFCRQCNRIRLTSEGFLKPCLYYSRGIPLREKLRSGISVSYTHLDVYKRQHRRGIAPGRRLFRTGDPEYKEVCAVLLGT